MQTISSSANNETDRIDCSADRCYRLSVLAQTARKAAPPGRSAERQLIELERQLSGALVRQDAKVLDQTLRVSLIVRYRTDGAI